MHASHDTVDNVPKNGLSVAQASKYVGVSKTTIYNLIAAGKINKCKIGRRTLLKREELDELLALAGK